MDLLKNLAVLRHSYQMMFSVPALAQFRNLFFFNLHLQDNLLFLLNHRKSFVFWKYSLVYRPVYMRSHWPSTWHFPRSVEAGQHARCQNRLFEVGGVQAETLDYSKNSRCFSGLNFQLFRTPNSVLPLCPFMSCGLTRAWRVWQTNQACVQHSDDWGLKTTLDLVF